MKLQLFHIWASAPILLSLALLLLQARGLAFPQHPAAFLPTPNSLEWEAALLQLQTWLGAPVAGGPRVGGPWPEMLARLQGVESQLGWKSISFLRGQREVLGNRHVGPFPQHPMEEMHYQQGGENEGGGGEKRNEALTSIAGGLQAFNRQKGGFGFRFGRK